MNQSKAFLTSFVFAVIAMALVGLYVSDKEGAIKEEFGNEVGVVVASRDINEFEVVQSNMLRTIVVPKKFAQPGSQSDPKIFEGTVATSPIRKDEQVLLTKVLPKGAETGLATQVAINHRAISIPIDDRTGVSRLLKPGDRIDLVTSVSYDEAGGQQMETKTFLQDVQVLAIGEVIQDRIPSAFVEDPVSGNRRAVNMRGNRNFSTITIEVKPEEAQMLILAMSQGFELFTTLRNPVDRVKSSIPTTTVDQVLGPDSQKARAAARRTAPPPPAVVVPRPAAPAVPPPNPFFGGSAPLLKGGSNGFN